MCQKKNFGHKSKFLVLNPATENLIGLLVRLIFKKSFLFLWNVCTKCFSGSSMTNIWAGTHNWELELRICDLFQTLKSYFEMYPTAVSHNRPPKNIEKFWISLQTHIYFRKRSVRNSIGKVKLWKENSNSQYVDTGSVHLNKKRRNSGRKGDEEKVWRFVEFRSSISCNDVIL